MENAITPSLDKKTRRKQRARRMTPGTFMRKLGQQKTLVFMSVPFLIWLIIFKYLPLWGWSIAFQDFKPAKKILDQEWVGFQHFAFLFQDEHFLRVMRNTLAMSFINLVLGFVTAITLAILLNELRNVVFKRFCPNGQLFTSLYILGGSCEYYLDRIIRRRRYCE